ncbi:MAG: radical SAM protein [Deltaproteobacteria bacterium HGW-Deltaproteobacteria-10]|nr:MAG: radical SAM protein [Deltaproteobacteria bacterium HGW-Deltaproteobacteria-10]
MKKNNHLIKTAAKPLIIPIFVMNSGCPHRCIFCNQKISAGNHPQKLNKEYFENEINSYLKWNKDKSRLVEIAFYGGSFTGIDKVYQEHLLSWAQSYLQAGLVNSIRVSTRPDYIDIGILARLKKYGVTTVEIGAQSFIDDVLQFAQRGHNAADTIKAIRLLKENNFQTSLHLMAGLPKDTKDGFIFSVEKTMELKPDMVRIHPVVVFHDTALAREFAEGSYQPLLLSEAVSLCAIAREKLATAGIRVIRTGLHLTKEMENNNTVLAGPLHPAFGSLVLAAMYYDKTRQLLEQIPSETREISFKLHNSDISSFRGPQNNNIAAIKKLYPQAVINVRTSPEQKRGLISVTTTDQGGILTTAISGIT